MGSHRVRVSPLPNWVDATRLLGPGAWRREAAVAAAGFAFETELTRASAADLEARLRGVALGGHRLAVEISPPLPRASVRAARAVEARRYRQGSPGFSRKGARLDDEARRSLTPEALALVIGE